MMRVDRKQLNDVEVIVGDRQTVRLDAARSVSRRQQALLAAAGESEPVTRRWYVLTVEASADIAVDNVLANAGIEHWMAVEKRDSKWRGGRKFQRFCPIVKPAFAGYIFVRVAWGEMTWLGLAGIDGVTGVVGGAISPASLPDKQFDKFRAYAEKDPKFLKILRNALDVGDRVRIDDGPFSHFEAVLIELDEASARVKVEVELFGRDVPVDLDLAQVTKLD